MSLSYRLRPAHIRCQGEDALGNTSPGKRPISNCGANGPEALYWYKDRLFSLCCFCLFWDRVLLCSPGWTGTRSACFCLSSTGLDAYHYCSAENLTLNTVPVPFSWACSKGILKKQKQNQRLTGSPCRQATGPSAQASWWDEASKNVKRKKKFLSLYMLMDSW